MLYTYTRPLTPICKPLGFTIHQASDYIVSYPNNHEIGIFRTKTYLKEDTVSNQNETSWNDSKEKGKSVRREKEDNVSKMSGAKERKKKAFSSLGIVRVVWQEWMKSPLL